MLPSERGWESAGVKPDDLTFEEAASVNIAAITRFCRLFATTDGFSPGRRS